MSDENSKSKDIRLAISAGEVSGDRHAAKLVKALKHYLPDAQFCGMGGEALRQLRVDTIVDSQRSAGAMGIWEVFKSLRAILKSLSDMKHMLREWRPQALIVVDYPDFNMRLANYAKSLNIPVFWYISPKVWAWRSERVKTLQKVVEQMALIFPFERDFYEKRGMTQVAYVGHPTTEEISSADLKALRAELHIQDTDEVVVFMPGSRKFELRKLLRPMLQAFKNLASKNRRLVGVIVAAPSAELALLYGTIRNELGETLAKQMRVTRAHAIQVMQVASAGVLKSGTCNLEAACVGLPFVSVYSGSRFAEFMIRKLKVVPLAQFSPVNVVRADSVKEIMDVNVDPKEIEAELQALLTDGPYRVKVQAALKEVHGRLLGCDELPIFEGANTVSERAAKLFLNMNPTKAKS